jgi:hypothetical protein
VQRSVTGQANQLANMLVPEAKLRSIIRPFGWIVTAGLANDQKSPNRVCEIGTKIVSR